MFGKIQYTLLFLLITFSGIKAQKYEATLYYLDGSKRNGKAEAVLNGEPKLAFIENGQSQREKVRVEELEKVEYHNKSESVTVERKEFIYHMGNRKPKSDFNWMTKIHAGEVSVYTSSSYDPGVNFNMEYRVTPTNVKDYFFQYKNEKPELIYFISSDMVLNKKEIIANFVKYFFENKCPDLVANFNRNKIKLNGNPMPLIKYYEEHCSNIKN